MTSDDRRIAAVVVTFNRLDLLQRLVGALADTDGLDEILVVDNASTDGTGEWLRSAEADTERLHARHLADNTGGAGGFHEGLRWAVERGADLVWLMDDDGLPEPGCLRTLLAHDGDARLLGAGGRRRDRSRAAGLPDPAARAAPGWCTRWPTSAPPPTDGLIRDIVIPFNGVLLTRALVERIGLPRAEFFIWGDDHEYRLRAERSGARIATVVDARVRHPSVGALGTPMAFGRTTYNDTPSDLKHYCMARNNLRQPPRVRRAPARGRVRRQDPVVLHLHPPRPGADPAQSRRLAGRAPRRLHRPREVPVMTSRTRDRRASSSSPTTAPTCSAGCSTAWPRRPTSPTR